MTQNMGDNQIKIDIREVTERDSNALTRLAENNPDSGAVSIAPQYATDPCNFYSIFCSDTTGFVAETTSGDVVGMGFISFQDVRVGGKVRKIGFLRGLVVKQEFRRQGLGTRLAAKRIDLAKRKHGSDCVIIASIQSSNDPSRAVTATWANAYAYDRSSWAITPRETSPDTDYNIRQVRVSELPRVVRHANSFYSDAELYRPYRSPTLQEWLFESSKKNSLRKYFIALDGDKIIAGIDVIDFYKRRWLEVKETGDLPSSVPQSGEIRPRRIGNLWFINDAEDAARDLVEAVRMDPSDANRIWFQSDGDGAFASTGIIDTADEIIEITTAVQGVHSPKKDHPVADLF